MTSVYKKWFNYRDHFPKKARYTLGDKIDSLFLETLELLFVASYQRKNEKLPTLEKILHKIDVLKFFLQISWEITALDTKKFSELSEGVHEIGKMVGGWKKGLASKTPTH